MESYDPVFRRFLPYATYRLKKIRQVDEIPIYIMDITARYQRNLDVSMAEVLEFASQEPESMCAFHNRFTKASGRFPGMFYKRELNPIFRGGLREGLTKLP